ncbi:MAG TPA: hypothetical protein VFU97_24620 [Xanthobacteraceae bacterium]|nr:hypothetical protein [Xanthobacteraceae bacterium]
MADERLFEFFREQMRLERLRFAADLVISRAVVESPDGLDLVRSYTDDYVRRVAFDLVGRKAEHVVTFPTDWWQHFKQRWFPAWALKRWPVRLTEVRATASQLFPEIKPAFGRYVVITGFDGDVRRRL